MNKYYKEAEKELMKANSEIVRIVGTKGEDISYYNHTAMDYIINQVIKVKTLMAMGQLTNESHRT